MARAVLWLLYMGWHIVYATKVYRGLEGERKPLWTDHVMYLGVGLGIVNCMSIFIFPYPSGSLLFQHLFSNFELPHSIAVNTVLITRYFRTKRWVENTVLMVTFFLVSGFVFSNMLAIMFLFIVYSRVTGDDVLEFPLKRKTKT